MKGNNTLKQTTIIFMLTIAVAVALLQFGCVMAGGLSPGSAARMDADATAALNQLYAQKPAAKKLGSQAKAILIFPDVLKGGFMIGGQTGNGVMRENGRTAGYYNTTGASYGYQVGLQTFGYVLFLMDDAALQHLHDTGGWELGTGPSLVVVDEGMAKSLSTTTVQKDVYAFIFNQSGLMAGVGLQGSKITEIQP
jgi:lipid-binding SYLF domain-containing protein